LKEAKLRTGWVHQQVYTDDDISTKFHWQRPHMLSSESTATVTWKIPEGTEDGTYMIWNYGDYKHLTGGTVPFTGHSSKLAGSVSLSVCLCLSL